MSWELTSPIFILFLTLAIITVSMKKAVILFILTSILSHSAFCQFSDQNEITKSISYPTGVRPYDLDGDGDLDILFCSKKDSKVGWYENLGNNSFGEQKVISLNVAKVEDVYGGDLDNDGDIDVISASYDDDQIAWYENLGNGTFSAKNVLSSTADGAQTVYAIDIDNDGDIDVFAGSRNDNEVSWFQNLGNGVFSAEVVISSTAYGPWTIHSNDLDNDGNIDLICVLQYSSSIVWYKNLGFGTFGSPQVVSNFIGGARDVYSIDLDGDSDIDLLSAAYDDNHIAWYENLGGGVFGPQQILLSGFLEADAVFSVDMDGDLDNDVIASSLYLDQVVWLENLGAGTFGPPQIITTNSNGPYTFCVADIDTDLDQDILIASYQDNKIVFLENIGSATFAPEVQLSVSAFTLTSIALTDYDNDGDDDVFFASEVDNKVGWYENLGGSVFGVQNIISDSAMGASEVFAVDIDNDSDIDILSTSYVGNKISIYENQNGSFSTEVILSSSINGAYDVFACDLDNDLDNDVVAVAFNSSEISWFENMGNNVFGSPQVLTSTSVGLRRASATDLDGDGDLDILYAAFATDEIGIFENLGNGVFGSVILISNLPDANHTIAFDVDGDLDEDIVWGGGGFNDLYWRENLGMLNFGANQLINATLEGVMHLKANDIDLDGDLDLFVASASDGKISWFENIGTGFGNQNIIANTWGPQQLELSDFDNDGDFELIAAMSEENRIAWFENYFINDYSLSGKIFFDQNQNAQFDSSEVGFNFIPLNALPSTLSSFSSADGNYFFSADTGSYIVSYTLPNTLWNLSTDSSSFTSSLTAANPQAIDLDFGFYPDSIVTILQPDIVGGFPRCNDTVNYWISVQNLGTTTPNGILQLQLDDSLTYITSSILPDSIVGQNCYWSFDTLNFYSQKIFSVEVQMPDFMSLGNQLTSSFTSIEIDSLGNLGYFASDSLTQTIVCAYDPNDKIVTPAGIGPNGYILPETPLEYLIRFQNTGNDTAMLVVIRDTLDTNLDWTSLQPISSSHDVSIWIENGGVLVCEFNDIMLPDSNVNFLGSQGYIKFKIEPKSDLSVNTEIANSADIYFDSNPPVITNSTLNTIYFCDSTVLSLNQSLVCFGDSLIAFSSNYDMNTYTWNSSAFGTIISDTLIWIADTSDVFTLNLSVSNPLCIYDTVVNFNVLQVIPPTEMYETICFGDSALVFGNYINISGVYTDSLQSFLGCDSIISVDLTVELIDVTIISTDTSIISIANGASYQWLDCGDNYTPIFGATSQSYYPSDNGEFAVQIIQFGCADTSQCIEISTLRLNEDVLFNEVLIYPNPTSGNFSVDFGYIQNVDLKLYSIRGEIVYQNNDIISPYNLDLKISDGVYILELCSEGIYKRYKLVKNIH